MRLKSKLLAGSVVIAVLVAVGYVFFAPQRAKYVDQPESTVERELEPLKRGTFAGADAVHQVKGSVQLRGAGSRLSLRFSNYDATSGPDVYFYLARAGEFDPQTARRVVVPGGGTEGQATLRGNFSVVIDGGVSDLESYSRLVVWCERFGVKFGEAALE